ncbi:MAG: extracellular solute-binding protein [Clostridia bacterium]|nr:extracellular solute-binding protein [Clostridia bacterium]
MQTKRKLSRLLSVVLAVFLVLPLVFGCYVNAAEKLYGAENPYTDELIKELMDIPFYSVLKRSYDKAGYRAPSNAPENTIVVTPDTITGENGEKVTLSNRGPADDQKNAFYWTYDNKTVTWTFEITEAGLYQFALDYYLEPGKGADPVRKLLVDGEKLYYEADNHIFYRYFADENGDDRVLNTDGDEMRPRALEINKWRNGDIVDYYGFFSMPIAIYFGEGTHTVTMEYYSGDMAIGDLTVSPKETLKSYADYKAALQADGLYKQATTIEPITFEAEFHTERNGSAIRREADGDPACSPYQWDKKILNIIGAGTWYKANKAITWSFNVKEAGVYKIALRQFQAYNDNISSFRKIEIDGEVPFAEFAEYEFEYSSNKSWKNYTLSIDDEAVYYYFDEGEHTITMTVVMGDYTELIQSIYYDMQLMTDFMNDIRQITGANPDYNYDYGFYDGDDKRGFKAKFQMMSDSMAWKYDFLVENSSTGKIPSMANSFKFLKTSFDTAIKYEYRIAKLYDTDFLSAQSSLSTYYSSLQSQNLAIDDFTIYNDGYKLPKRESTFWQKFSSSIKNFFLSFTKDYDSIKGVQGAAQPEEIVKVWIARGIDWAELFKELADTTFTPESKIGVQLSIMPAGQLTAGATNALMLAIASGKNIPDLCVSSDIGSPAEFAVREATYDLSTFEDFDIVREWFLDVCMNPLTYNGGVYGLPETMDFKVFFYRTDIFEELGLEVPETRNDIYNYIMPALYRQQMTVGMGRDELTYILQHGGSLYTEDLLYSGLGTPEAYLAMKEQTDLFTKYAVPVQQDFYNRFRTGETPCGIGTFATYIQLKAAAPELNGRWSIALLPGLEKVNTETGETYVDRSHSGSIATASFVMATTEKPNECWALLKWWMSEETQTEYGVSIEGIVGESARWNSANLESFDKMNWNVEDLQVIQKTREWVYEYPYILGSYFTTRHLTNAYTKVVMNHENLRDALESAVRDINRELKMKHEEYGFGHLYETEGV